MVAQHHDLGIVNKKLDTANAKYEAAQKKIDLAEEAKKTLMTNVTKLTQIIKECYEEQA